MKTIQSNRMRWVVVVVFAMAMAWVESSVVFYLRTMIHRIEPYQANPLPVIGGFGPVEAVREFATMIMLLTVGMLAGTSWRSRIGYSAIAFGVWDIAYYLFLKVMCGWPHSLLDWDILFLLPLPWWGPVLAPALIALLMIVWGTLASQIQQPQTSPRVVVAAWGIALVGMGLSLVLFMIDTLKATQRGTSIRTVLPEHFQWPMFGVALMLMSVPIWTFFWKMRLASSEFNTLPFDELTQPITKD